MILYEPCKFGYSKNWYRCGIGHCQCIEKVWDPKPKMLLCWKHFLDNIKRKLIQLEITEKYRDDIIVLFTGQADIAGLLDYTSTEHLVRGRMSLFIRLFLCLVGLRKLAILSTVIIMDLYMK